MAMVAIILWVSAVASAFVDNIPFAATMVPVIQAMAQTQGVDLHVLAWALSMGTDLGGSATPIGASANVVGTSVAAKNGHPVTWGKYCRYCAPGHHHGDGGVHGVHCGAVHVNQKDLRLGRGSFIAIKENHCSHSGGTHHGHIRNSGRGCIFSDTIHMGAVNGSSARYTFRMPNTFPISESPFQQSSESSLHEASSPRRRRSKYMRSSRDSMEKNNM